MRAFVFEFTSSSRGSLREGLIRDDPPVTVFSGPKKPQRTASVTDELEPKEYALLVAVFVALDVQVFGLLAKVDRCMLVGHLDDREIALKRMLEHSQGRVPRKNGIDGFR